jgi:TDG/mug DNA glycosylase family protein
MLVGINPGVMSATTGHHFAGPTNRFWRLLHESGIVPEPVTHEDDVRLPAWGIGMTNLVARPTPGIDTLRPEEYLEGWTILEKKIDRFRPAVVAFVGVTMYRALWRVIGQVPGAPKPKGSPVIKPGFQHATVHGARLFVLPNPSGRNAHFSYADMLAAFTELARAMRVGESEGRSPSDEASELLRPRLPSAGASSAGSAGAAPGRSPRAAGTAARTTPSTPAAAPFRKAPRKRAASRS